MTSALDTEGMPFINTSLQITKLSLPGNLKKHAFTQRLGTHLPLYRYQRNYKEDTRAGPITANSSKKESKKK